jgi:Tfp pilus assembly protein PilF
VIIEMDLIFCRATAYSKLGKMEEAEQNYRKAIEVQPDFMHSYTNLSELLSRYVVTLIA